MAPTDISSKFPIHKRTAPSVSVPDTKSYSLLPSAENATTGPHPLSEFFIPNQTTKELVMMTEKIKTTVENIKQSSTTAQATEERANLTTPQMISHIPYNNYTVKEDIKIVPISATTTFQISSQMMQSNPTSVQENQKISANPQINPNMLYLDGPAAKFENQNRLLQLEENDEDKHEEEGQSTEEAEGEETEDTEETTKGKLKYKERNNIKEHSVLDSLESYSREECERDHQKTCVCSFESVKTDFIRIFSIVKSTKSAMDEISHFDCRHFVPILDQFVLSSNAKPSVLSGNHKPMTVDSEKGPKEIDEKSMDVFVSQSVSEEDDLTHVFVNTDVEIPCFPTSDIHLSPSEADHVSYKWTFGNKKAITVSKAEQVLVSSFEQAALFCPEGRITENSDGEGSLSITEVTSGDSENYTCEVEYINPDTGHHTEETFEHVLNVVALPIVTVRLSLHYRGSLACDSSIIQMFKLFMPQQLEDFVCKIDEDKHLCKIEVHSTVCHTESPDESRVFKPSLNCRSSSCCRHCGNKKRRSLLRDSDKNKLYDSAVSPDETNMYVSRKVDCLVLINSP
ncbi:hypothetical protein J6590_021698 [Homalodisca vitripennis]|nr:hypothetical protein J6590_021698 [Homalodisca vitripennis]